MKKTISLILAGLWLGCTPLGAVANEATLIKADALIKNGKAAEAYALLDPLEAKLAGDPTFDYLLATAALEAGNPSRATFIYERILAVNPDFIGVRADMGRAYYQMGDLARAKLEFETVLIIPNLPPDLRTAVEAYKSALDQQSANAKTVITGYAEAGFGRDNNVSSQTSDRAINTAFGPYYPSADQRKRADNFLSYGAGLEVVHFLDDGFAVFAGGDFRGRGYRSISEADNYSADTRVGLQYSSGRHLIRGGLLMGLYVLDNESNRDSRGLNLDYRYLLDEKNQFAINSLYSASRYIPEASKSEDSNLASLSFGWTHVLAPTTISVLNVTVGTEEATRDRADGDKNFWGLRGTMQHQISNSLGGYFTAGHQWGDYTKFNTTYGEHRKDRFADAAVGLVWSLPDRWSVRPQVAYTRNWSNESIFKYDRLDYSVALRRDF